MVNERQKTKKRRPTAKKKKKKEQETAQTNPQELLPHSRLGVDQMHNTNKHTNKQKNAVERPLPSFSPALLFFARACSLPRSFLSQQRVFPERSGGLNLSTMSRKLRILMLHGHAQTGEEMAKKAGALRSEVKKLAEFHHYESPVRNAAGQQTWYDWEEHGNNVSTYTGVDAALRQLAATFEEHGPFDGVWGFSMGALMTALLCDGVANDRLPPSVNFKFAVLFAAPSVRDPRYALRTDGSVAVPSFHVWGEADEIIAPERSRAVSEAFADPVTVTHEGGHLMPSAAPVRKALKQFIREQRELLLAE